MTTDKHALESIRRLKPTIEMIHVAFTEFNTHVPSQDAMRSALDAAFKLVEEMYDVYPKLTWIRPVPPDPCPFCTTGLASHCAWHWRGENRK